jgi:hypothetical protein
MKRTSMLAVAILVGCGSSSSIPADGNTPESMFGPPASGSKTTPDTIYGLWGGSASSGSLKYDLRLRVSAESTTLAARCSFADGTVLTVSASAASRISDDSKLACLPVKGAAAKCGEVTMLESKSDRSQVGDKWCSIDLKPAAYPYAVAGLTLEFQTDTERVDLVKISD